MTSDLNALIGSRICHDLISPLGAIGNGVELLNMSGTVDGPEMSLISESVENANARIKFFRVAFGAASAGQTLARGEVASILRDIGRDGRVVTDWQPQTDLARDQVKLAFLLILCLENALPRGGRITVNAVGGEWALTAEGERIAFAEDLWALLASETEVTGLEAANVQFALAPLAAFAMGRKLDVQRSERLIRVRF